MWPLGGTVIVIPLRAYRTQRGHACRSGPPPRQPGPAATTLCHWVWGVSANWGLWWGVVAELLLRRRREPITKSTGEPHRNGTRGSTVNRR
jgi:hypothetical protein